MKDASYKRITKIYVVQKAKDKNRLDELGKDFLMSAEGEREFEEFFTPDLQIAQLVKDMIEEDFKRDYGDKETSGWDIMIENIEKRRNHAVKLIGYKIAIFNNAPFIRKKA